MIGDRWTFLLVRDGHSTVKQYSLSSRLLRILVGGGLVAALILIGYAVTIGVDGYARLRSAQLDTRNTVLQDECKKVLTIRKRRDPATAPFRTPPQAPLLDG